VVGKYRSVAIAGLSIVSLALAGCSPSAMDGPFGPPRHSPLLTPYAGNWVLEIEKTVAAQKAAGAKDEEIAAIRKEFTEISRIYNTKFDARIDGNQAVGIGLPRSEYRMFAMHHHGSKLCGKAWHHEDRYDPGDMSKCNVRLSIQSGDLYLEVNMHEEDVSEADPDFLAEPPVEGDSARCDADKQNPKHWNIYVLSRRT
jgi:hypothetical protein